MIPEQVKHQAKLELARRDFWSFEQLLYPELFTDERKLLKEMAETIQSFIEDSDKHYLVLSVPPGHYKSFTAKNLALWLMGKDPKTRIIGVANSGDLASMFSTQIRDTILGTNYGKEGTPYPAIFPDTKVKYGFATKSKWELEGSSEPSYRATSPTSSITGSRADCLIGDTLINTRGGIFRIDELHNGRHQGDILTYNHSTDTIEYERLVATREIKSRKVYEVTLSNGTSFTGTYDHKVYIVGTGYRTIGWIKRNAERDTVHLRTLRQPLPTQEIRGQQSDTQGFKDTVLLSGLYGKENQYGEANKLLQMWQARKERLGLLFRSLSEKIRLGSEITEHRLSMVQQELQTTITPHQVLLNGVQEQTPLRGYKDSEVRSQLSKGVQGHSTFNHKKRRCLPQVFLDLLTERSPLRWGQTQQQSKEPRNDVQELSYSDAYVVSVQECANRESVYDIQTESNHNFFANGTLVHNCFIVDDIIKNHTEALNAHALKDHFEFYKNTLFSRTDGDNYKFIFVMQRWATNDLSGEIMKLYGDDVDVVSYEIEDKQGNMLEPTIMSRKKFEEAKRTLDPNILKANYYQQPVDIEGRLYNGFQEWTTLPDSPQRYNNTDVADQGKDNLCSINWIKKQDEDGVKVYITDIYYSPEKAEITEPAVAKMITADQITEAEFESNNGGKGYARNVERELHALQNFKTVVKWTPQNSNKEARIMASSSWVAKNVYMPPNWTSKYPEFAAEVLSYVAGGKNAFDDGVDTLATLYERAANLQPIAYSSVY